MARGPVRINQYDQRTNPQSVAQPFVRVTDNGAGQIAEGLARAGQTLRNEAQLQIQRDEDDGRVYASSAMARARASASEMTRRAFTEAQDGWRGATQRVSQEWGALREESLAAAPTPSAERFLLQSFDAFQPLMLEEVAGQEQTAREGWLVDTLRSSIDTNSGVLAVDPGQYEAVRAQQFSILEGLGNADQRRDLTAHAEQTFALSAVGALVEANPRAALEALQDAESEGPFQHLDGQQRITLISRAQAEINRQQSEARARRAEGLAALRDTVSAQNQLLSRGIMPSQALDVQMLASTLGPDVAQNYIANLAGAAATQGMADMPLSVVAQVAAGATSPDHTDAGNLVTVEARRAATSMLQDRNADPAAYALSHNLLPHPDLLPTISQAVQSGDWSGAGVALRQRSVAAVDLRDRGVVSRVAPLSTPEAQALSQGLANLPTQARLQFYASLSQNMDREAYTAVMGQISESAPVAAFAGFLWNNPAGRAQNSRGAAERLLRGAELLHGRQADGSGRGSSLVDMPTDAELLSEWRSVIGDAYAHMRGTARPGEAGPEEQAFEVFRTYYAGLSEGADSDRIDTDRARRAATLASGGVTQWGPANRETLMPWGMTRSQFEDGVRRGFERIGQRGVDPSDYELRAMGGGRYQVFTGNLPARNTTGGNLYITVVRPQ